MRRMSLMISRIVAALSVRSGVAVGATSMKRAGRGVRLPYLILALFCLYLLLAVAYIPAVAQDPPAAPTNLMASFANEGVLLSWTAPAGDVDGYEILRRRPLQHETELTTLVDNTGSSETSYTDTSATTPGERYSYWVKAIRGDDRSVLSNFVDIDFVSLGCEIISGDNHDILHCEVDAGALAITSAEWTPSFEVQYTQITDGPVANWVIADEYCGQSTTVTVDASAGDTVLLTDETTITLECSPTPSDTLTVSCETLIVNSQHELRCALSGGDQTIDSALWTPSFDLQSAQTTVGAAATEATWVISAEQCGQTASIEVVPQAGDSTLPTIRTTISIPCVITVDGNCSLANAIRSAEGIDQVEESTDTDGNDECEAGAAPDETASPPATGDDIILLTTNVTLAAALPSITSAIHIDGGGHTVSGDGQYQILNADGGQLSISDLTITEGLSANEGGGIYVSGGSLHISDSIIMNSYASDVGGGIYALDSDVDIADTEISGNMTIKSHGGGIYFISSTGLNTFDVVGATFKKNMATEDGGALKTAGGIVTIDKSTFVENEADEGGAIESSQTTLDITNSTFSTNSAREGGGLSSFRSFVTLTHTTWAYNSAAEQGGGIAIIGWTGNFKIRNTLITDSASGGDCHSGPNPDIMLEFTGNFIQDGSCTPEPAESQAVASEGGVIEAEAQHVEHDEPVVFIPAGINALSGNPPHHPLQLGSPAIDNADPVYCLLDDQPQTARPQYGNCDIGAYEYPKPPDPTPDPPGPPDKPDKPDTPDTPDTPAPPVPNFCPVNDRIVVTSPSPNVNCAEIDILTLDKHPALQGIRFAVRLWRADNECMHVVSLGDNLYRLAIQYETTVEVLRRHNNLPNNGLSVGQHLVLPFCAQDAGSFDPGTEVCFDAPGSIVLIDTSAPERPIHSIETYASEGMTCGQINKAGIVALVAADTG